jgi:arabinofuranosyltransferase
VRPDLAVAVPVVLGGVLAAQWDGDRGRDRVRLVALALALPVAYQVFRMGYYGSLVPNTALAKSGGRGMWGNGWDYTRDLAQPYWLVVPLACLALAVLVPFGARAWHARDRRGLVALAALPVVGAADGLYVVRVGGDYMHGRLLLPALFALVAPVAAVPVTGVARAWTAGPGRRAALGAPVVVGAEPGTAGPGGARPDDVDGADPVATGHLVPRPGRPAGRRGRPLLPPAVAATAVVVVVWALVAGSTLRRDPDGVVADLFVGEAYEGQRSQYGPGAVTAEDQGWGRDRVRELFPPGTEVRLPEPLPGAKPRDGGGSRPVYASYGIGVGGYALGDGVYVLDMLGLADPLGSRFELERPGSTGHEKPIPAAWLAARVSDRPVPRGSLPEPPIVIPLYESPPGRFDADTEAARRTLGCGGLVDLGHAVHDRLTPGRFLRNLVGSLALTRLTVPADPGEAEQQLCG